MQNVYVLKNTYGGSMLFTWPLWIVPIALTWYLAWEQGFSIPISIGVSVACFIALKLFLRALWKAHRTYRLIYYAVFVLTYIALTATILSIFGAGLEWIALLCIGVGALTTYAAHEVEKYAILTEN